MRILATGDGTEVAAGTCAPDERLTLLPAGGDGSLSETYYLLSGGLVWHGQNGDVSFTEGDTITVASEDGTSAQFAGEALRATAEAVSGHRGGAAPKRS